MTPESARSSYRRLLASVGEPVIIRRYAGVGSNRPRFDVEVLARVSEFRADELIGPIIEGDRKIIVLAEDLIERQWVLPVRKDDKAVVRGRELNIEDSDDNTRRINGVLIALELRARG